MSQIYSSIPVIRSEVFILVLGGNLFAEITPQHTTTGGIRSGGKRVTPKKNNEIVMDPQEYLMDQQHHHHHQKGTKGNGWIATMS